MDNDSFPEHKPRQLTPKQRRYHFSGRIKRWLSLTILIFIIVEGIFIGIKVLSNRPNERMCWDNSMCFTYCYVGYQGICQQPPAYDTAKTVDALKLFFTGKRNIIEVLNKKQEYCACEITEGKERNIETFYNFYVQNKK